MANWSNECEYCGSKEDVGPMPFIDKWLCAACREKERVFQLKAFAAAFKVNGSDND